MAAIPSDIWGLAVLSALCAAGGMLGTRMKWHARVLKGEAPKFDKQTFFSGLYVAGGAGLVTALIGQGIHVNRGMLIGASIVAGYAGGPRFFDWLARIVERISARRFADAVKDGAADLEKLLDDTDDGDEKEEDPP